MTKKKTEIKTAKAQKKNKKPEIAEAQCNDKDCYIHGKLKLRGRVFRGKVIKKFPRRVTIELEKMVYIPKYERYLTKRSKHHARLPDCMEKNINVGDRIKIRECRPLSKIVTFSVVEKINTEKDKK